MTAIGRATGIGNLPTIYPDNASRLIEPANPRAAETSIWESAVNLVDDKLLLNLRTLTDRPYEVGEGMFYVDGGNLAIYRAIAPVTGLPFVGAQWEKIPVILANGNGTTANGSAVNLGGTLLNATTIDGQSTHWFTVDKVPAFIVNADTLVQFQIGDGFFRMNLDKVALLSTEVMLQASPLGIEIDTTASGVNPVILRTDAVTVTRTQQFPDKSGTIALLDDIPVQQESAKDFSVSVGQWTAGGEGAGSTFYFVFTHNLGTDKLLQPSVWETVTGDRNIIQINEFYTTGLGITDSLNQVRIEISGAEIDVDGVVSTGGSSVIVMGDGVSSVSGSMVDNTDPLNPVINSDDTKSNKAAAQTLANTASITLTSNSADRSINIYAGELVTVTIATAAVLEVGEGFEVNVGDAFGFVFDVGSENLFGIITGSTTVGDSVFIRRLPDNSFGLTGRVYKVS